MAEYRIVTDRFCGFEVQVRRWWFPFWMQACGGGLITNTHSTIEKAEKYAENHAENRVEDHARGTVKYLGKFVESK